MTAAEVQSFDPDQHVASGPRACFQGHYFDGRLVLLRSGWDRPSCTEAVLRDELAELSSHPRFTLRLGLEETLPEPVRAFLASREAIGLDLGTNVSTAAARALLASTNVEVLQAREVDLATVASVSRLRVLDASIRQPSWLRRASALEVLRARSTFDSLEPLRELQALRRFQANVVTHDLTPLAGLLALEEITVVDAPLRDSSLSALQALPRLRRLNLAGVRVSAEGFRPLSAMTRLERLSLDNTDVTDDGLAHLSALTNLRVLGLAYAKVSDRGLSALAPLSALRDLNLASVALRGDGLASLASLRGLRALNLSGARGLRPTATRLLGDLVTLESLELGGVALPAEALVPLRGLVNLRLLLLDDETPRAAVDALHEALPRAFVSWGDAELGPPPVVRWERCEIPSTETCTEDP